MAQYQYFEADYYYIRPGQETGTRTQMRGSVSQHLRGATSESAVVNYLRSKHSGYEINLMGLEWE